MSINRAREKRPISYQEAAIENSVVLSTRVKRLTLKPKNPFDWIPGQFVITKTLIGEKEVISDYTIISSNLHNDTFDIVVDNYPGSRIGKLFHNAKIGDTITFKAPRGRFYLEAATDIDGIVFIFRDIGIAAAIPLLRDLYERKSSSHIRIFNVLTTDFQSILEDEIDQFGQTLKISYKPLRKELVDLDEDKLSKGKFPKSMVEEIFGEFKKATFYLAGASEFNKTLRQKLIGIGVDKNKLFREMFG